MIGDALLCIPVILDILFFVTSNRETTGFFDYKSSASISGIPLMYWFLYLMILWTVFFLAQYIVRVVPALCIRITTLLFGKTYAGML